MCYPLCLSVPYGGLRFPLYHGCHSTLVVREKKWEKHMEWWIDFWIMRERNFCRWKYWKIFSISNCAVLSSTRMRCWIIYLSIQKDLFREPPRPATRVFLFHNELVYSPYILSPCCIIGHRVDRVLGLRALTWLISLCEISPQRETKPPAPARATRLWASTQFREPNKVCFNASYWTRKCGL